MYNHQKYTKTSLYDHLAVFSWNSCGLSKYIKGHQGQTLQTPLCTTKKMSRVRAIMTKTRFDGTVLLFTQYWNTQLTSINSHYLAASPTYWVFLFAETFRSFVRNSLKASVIFSSSGNFYDWNRHYERIGLNFIGHFKRNSYQRPKNNSLPHISVVCVQPSPGKTATSEDLLTSYCCAIKNDSKTILSQIPQLASADKGADMSDQQAHHCMTPEQWNSLLCSVSVTPANKLSFQGLNQLIGVKLLTSGFWENFGS